MKFAEVVGQDALKKQLLHGANSGRIPHAQLFLGQSGNGTLPLALAYAQYLSCKQRLESDSCGQCSSCKKYETLTHPDLHFSFPFPSNKADVASELLKEWRSAFLGNPYINIEQWMLSLEAENKQGNIPIKECRAIIKSLSLKPFESEYKVLLMWLPEFLGNEGNVLLKIIEEPPQNTLFLLVSESSEKLLSTVISRTQPVRVPPIGIDKIARALEEKYQLNAQDAMRIAQMSQGNYITAQSLIGETENPYFDQWRNWMNLCYAKKMPQLMEWSESMSGLGREALKSFLLYGMEILRGVLVYGFTASANTWIGQEKEFVERFSKLGMPVSAIEKIVVALEMAIANLERNASPKLILTDLSFSVAKNLKK